MNPFFASILILLFSNFAFSQLPDTALIENLLSQADSLYQIVKHEEGLALSEKALSLAQEIDENDKWTIKALNKVGLGFRELGKYKESYQQHRAALAILLEQENPIQQLLADTYIFIGQTTSYIPQLEQPRPAFQKALEIRRQVFGNNHPEVAKVLIALGSLDMFTGRLESAIRFLEKAYTILMMDREQNGKNLVSVGYYLGNTHFKLADFQKALMYFFNNIPLIEESFGPQHPAMGFHYNSIGNCYVDLAQFETALDYYQKDMAIQIKNFGEQHPNVGIAYGGIGDCYYQLKKYDMAIASFEKGLALSLSSFGLGHASTGSYYQLLGINYLEKKQYNKALEYFQKALSSNQSYWGEKHGNVAASYHHIAKTLFESGYIEKAVPYLKKALLANNYETNQFEVVFSNHRLLKTLSLKARVKSQYYQQSQKRSDLRLVYDSWLEAIQCLDFMNRNITEPLSKEQLFKSVIPIYEGIIKVCLELFRLENKQEWLNQAWHFAEKSKAQILSQTLRESHAWAVGDVPDSLQQQDKELKKAISDLHQQLFKAVQEEDSLEQAGLHTQIFEKKTTTGAIMGNTRT